MAKDLFVSKFFLRYGRTVEHLGQLSIGLCEYAIGNNQKTGGYKEIELQKTQD